MYILAEPYEESEIDAIQTGEYIQALRLAEERARAKKSETEDKEVVDISEDSQDQQAAAADETSPAPATENSESEIQLTTSAEDDDLDGTSVSDSLLNTPDRDLLGMVLKTQSYINGKPITGPPTPTAQDRWEMTFTYETLPPDRAQRLHQMSTDRRRKALDEEFREQALEENVNVQKKEWNRGFLMHLKELSSRGKVWREEFERTVGKREKVVWHEGPPPSKHGTMAWREGK